MSKNKKPSNKYSKISLWLINHLHSCIKSIGELLKTPLASLMTLMVIGIAMALPTGFYILLQNIQHINQHWQGKPSISLYLKLNTSPELIDHFMQQLKQQPNIAQVQYISPEQGLQQFVKQTQSQQALVDLTANPLPGVIVVTPAANFQTPQAMQNLLQQLKNSDLVDLAQSDMTWVKRLYFIIQLGERMIYALALLFSIGVILIISNVIRLSTQRYQQEILVLRLVGANSAFIRRPLLYQGMLFGFFGGAIAWLLIAFLLWWLEKPAQALAMSYQNTFAFYSMNLETGFLIMLICTLLGFIGSWLAINKYLTAAEVI